MLKFKKALFDYVSERTERLENLNGISQDFIYNHDADDGGYFCDAFSESADSNVSIYYYDIKKFIIENFDAVEDAINEFGWDGCGSDLYKAGQMAEYLKNERDLESDFEEIKKHLFINFLDSTENADEDAEAIWAKMDESEKSEILADILNDLENIDSNDYIDSLVDIFNDFIEKIKGDDA